MTVATAVDHGLLGLLAEHVGARASGMITARRGKHKRLFCLDRGQPVYARSNVIEEQFDVTLTRTGVLDGNAVAAASRLAEERGIELPALLVEQGTPGPDALARAMADHIVWLFEDTLAWTAKAEFDFAKGRPKLEGEPLARLDGARFVVACARKIARTKKGLRMAIGPPAMRPALVRRRRKLLPDASDPVADYLLAACDGKSSIDDLIAAFDGAPLELLQGLYALRLLGMIEHHADDARQLKDDTPSYRECVARFDAAEGADHYGVLGLAASCDQQAVRDAYYYLAKRFHPDRLRTPELRELGTRTEEFFSRVTEAYNTLYDPELRGAYDRHREEQSTRREKKDPTTDPSYIARQNYARGKLLLDKARYQDAIQFLENAVTQDDTVAQYHLELGRVLVRNPRRRGDAETYLLGALERDPTLVDAYFALGQLFRKTGRDAEAVERFREVLRWDPHHAEARAELADMGVKASAGDDGGLLSGWFKK